MRTKTLLAITVFTFIYTCSKGQITMKRTAYQWPENITAPIAEKKTQRTYCPWRYTCR